MPENSVSSFDGAIIKHGGGIPGPEETGIQLFCIQRNSAPILYGEYDEIFAENGNDFGFQIGRFGYGNRAAAGSTSPFLRYHFTRDDRERIETLIQSFFLDPKSIKEWMPPLLLKGLPILGLRYSKDWILEE